MSTKRFCAYDDAELLALSQDELTDAIRIEAIERGFAPPMVLSEALKSSEYRGYQRLSESVAVFEIVLQGADGYGTHNTGLGYFSEERANSVLEGIVQVEDDRYSAKKGTRFKDCKPYVLKRLVGGSVAHDAYAKLVEYLPEKSEEFDAVTTECVEKFASVRQAAYNTRVNAEKKAEYMRLANGDEAVARNFWAKVEKSQWPE
jgi:hypothetical protein